MYTAKKAGKNAYCLYAPANGSGNHKAAPPPPVDPGNVKIPIGPQGGSPFTARQ
jgi:hypothetical protein